MGDKLTLTTPLLIKLLEWAREEAKDDEAIHTAVERAYEEHEREEVEGEDEPLDMDDYQAIIGLGREPVHAHFTKEAVQYTDSGTEAEHCSICYHYISKNTCEIVLGSVTPQGWCNRFEDVNSH